MRYHAGISIYNRVTWNVRVYKGIRCNKDIVPDCYFSNYYGICTNPNTVANNRATFSLTSIFFSDKDTFVYVTIISDDCIRINRDIKRMIYGKSLAYFA